MSCEHYGLISLSIRPQLNTTHNKKENRKICLSNDRVVTTIISQYKYRSASAHSRNKQTKEESLDGTLLLRLCFLFESPQLVAERSQSIGKNYMCSKFEYKNREMFIVEIPLAECMCKTDSEGEEGCQRSNITSISK